MLSDNQLLKYSRQILLDKIDIDGQQKLLQSTVIIVGLGGLGSPVAMYLAAAGVGNLILIDDDQVDLSNLQRQIIHSHSTLGQDKVASAKQQINQLNPDCVVREINHRCNENELSELLTSASLVVDCSDNFETRFSLNRACYKNKG